MLRRRQLTTVPPLFPGCSPWPAAQRRLVFGYLVEDDTVNPGEVIFNSHGVCAERFQSQRAQRPSDIQWAALKCMSDYEKHRHCRYTIH